MPKTALAALVLALLVPAAASAQAAQALGNPDPSAVPEPPARMELDPEILALRGGAPRVPAAVPSLAPSPSALRDRGTEAPSFGASLGHAAAGWGIGVGAGGLLGGGITLGLTCQGSGGLCLIFGFVGAGFGAAALSPVGAALGAWGFGERRGGTGNFFAALGGAYLGAGLGVGVGSLIGMAGDPALGLTLGPIAGALLTMLGAAGGYQLSSHGSRGVAPESVSIVPTFDTVEGGATVGVAGAF